MPIGRIRLLGCTSVHTFRAKGLAKGMTHRSYSSSIALPPDTESGNSDASSGVGQQGAVRHRLHHLVCHIRKLHRTRPIDTIGTVSVTRRTRVLTSGFPPHGNRRGADAPCVPYIQSTSWSDTTSIIGIIFTVRLRDPFTFNALWFAVMRNHIVQSNLNTHLTLFQVLTRIAGIQRWIALLLNTLDLFDGLVFASIATTV